MNGFVRSIILLTFLLLVSSPGIAQAQDGCNFQHPLRGFDHPTGVPFGGDTGFESFHTGVDYVNWEELDLIGEPVYPVLSGEVIWVGDFPSWGNPPWANSIIVRSNCSGKEFNILYEHLDPDWQVAVGDQVIQERPFAKIGPCSGFCSEPHLHVGFFANGIDPLAIEREEIRVTNTLWRDPEAYLTTYTSNAAGGLGTKVKTRDNDVFDLQKASPIILGLLCILIFLSLLGPLSAASAKTAASGGNHMASAVVGLLFFGLDEQTKKIIKGGFLIALLVACPIIIFISTVEVYLIKQTFINKVIAAQSGTIGNLSEIADRGTEYAAIYGHFRGWGSVGHLDTVEEVIESSVSNANLVSVWVGKPIRPIVILNIIGSGTKLESQRVIQSFLEEANQHDVIIMLDIQPTPEGPDFMKLCQTAVDYVESYPDGVWLSIDTEYFQNRFPAQSINDCADTYDDTLQRVGARGVVGIWEFPMNGDWLIDDPGRIVRERANSIVVPLFDGFGVYDEKVTKMQAMVDSHGGPPFGVVEWQTLYPDVYDYGFAPRDLLAENPWIFIRY